MAGLIQPNLLGKQILSEKLKKAWRNNYGLNPKHPGQFKDRKGKWIPIPTYSSLFDASEKEQ